MLPRPHSGSSFLSYIISIHSISYEGRIYMNNDSPFKDLSDDQLATVAGGRHRQSHSSHHSSRNHGHGHHSGNTYIVNNYYIIDSTDTQIASGSSKNSSNNGTNVSLGS